MPVSMQITDRQNHAMRRQRSREPAGLNDNAIIQCGVERMRGVLVTEKARPLVSLGEAKPCARQVAGLALDQSLIAPRSPISVRRLGLDHDDFRDARRGVELRLIAENVKASFLPAWAKPFRVGDDFRPHDFARNFDRIGGALGANDRRAYVRQRLAVLGFRRAPNKRQHRAGTIGHDDCDVSAGAPSKRLAAQPFAPAIKKNGGWRRLVNIETPLRRLLASWAMANNERALFNLERRRFP